MDMMQFQRQTTQLAMTQRMQESLRILQMSNADLADYLTAQALENPCLEVRVPEGASVAPALPSRGIQAGLDRDAFATVEGQPPSLLAHVEAQIDLAFFDPGDRRTALAFAEALEPSGWLGQPVSEVAAAASGGGGGAGHPRAVAGFGARGPLRPVAGRMPRAAARGSGAADLGAAHDARPSAASGRGADRRSRPPLRLRARAYPRESGADPQPEPQAGRGLRGRPHADPAARRARAARPGGWEVELTRAQLPRIRVSEAGDTGDRQADAWLARARSQARWLERAVERRQATLLRTAVCLVRHQADFLDQGPRALRPLSMEEVALELDLHPSTISRATATRLIETPRGLIPLRAFFSRSVSSDGPEAPQSQDALMALVREIIAREDRTKPFSDDAIVKQAKLAGAVLARRTVTKYRETLGIPSSYDRKRAAAAA